MTNTVVKSLGKIIHAAAKNKFLEFFFRMIINGKYLNSPLRRFIPAHDSYPNPTFRIAKRKGFVLHANLHDYNDWKAYWGFKETERENLYELLKMQR